MPRLQRPIAHALDTVVRTNDVKNVEHVDFSALHLSENVINGLKNSGFERPSPIQLQAIPLGRIGLDLIAQAKSGTGKTCVFGVIILEALNIKVNKCQCLVLAPTREIAAQINDVITGLGSEIEGLKCALIIGGRPLKDDKEAIIGTHIIIGTPGRILHMIEEGILGVECVRTFVMDEADKLVESTFYTPVKSIADMLPQSKQVLAMSATYDQELCKDTVLQMSQHLNLPPIIISCDKQDIDTKFNSMMREPYFVKLSGEKQGLEGIHHFHFTVKTDAVNHQIFRNKVQRLVDILSNVKFEQCLVFSNYKAKAEEMSDTLTKEGFNNQVIAGNMSQAARLEVMADFRECKFRVLISTDLTARGIDNEHVDMVINLDLPPDCSTYLHRTGRAGRFGKHGVALSIIAGSGTEKSFLQTIEEKFQVSVPLAPSYKQITELLGMSKSDVGNSDAFVVEDEECLTENDITALRSNVKVTKAKSESELQTNNRDHAITTSKSQFDQPSNSDLIETDGISAITSMSDLSLVHSAEESTLCKEDSLDQLELPGEFFAQQCDELSAFPFTSFEMMDTSCFSDLPTFPEEGGVSPGKEAAAESQKTPENDPAKQLRQRKGSKGSKKARKPPKSLNCITSPNIHNNNPRRAQSATAAFSDNIISPHTPKWRHDAVSTIGCIIHSKAIHVNFLLDCYLNEKYNHSEKHFLHDFRGYLPTREYILTKSSSSPHEVVKVKRFVSHGFVANEPAKAEIKANPAPRKEVLHNNRVPQDILHNSRGPQDVLQNHRIPHQDMFHCDRHDNPHCDQSFSTSSSYSSSSFRQPDYSPHRHPCSPHRPTDLPYLCREQSKDSGVYSPHPGYPYSPYPVYWAPPHCPPPPPWSHYPWLQSPGAPCSCRCNDHSYQYQCCSSGPRSSCDSNGPSRPVSRTSFPGSQAPFNPASHSSYPPNNAFPQSAWSRCWDSAFKDHS